MIHDSEKIIWLRRKTALLRMTLMQLLIVSYVTACVEAQANRVLVVELDTEITIATTRMFRDAMGIADAVDARLVVVEANTPGGEINAVKEIMDIFEASTIPVCLFVYPMGASAWSGGTYLLVSSHIAAMASGTSIGSAQPMYYTGEPINDTKRINALSALMMNHARLHDRNTTTAQSFIVNNLNLGPEDALRYHVIELVADDTPTLLKKLSEKTLIKVQSEEETSVWKLVKAEEADRYTDIDKFSFEGVDGAEIIDFEPGLHTELLEIIFDPVASSLMLVLGFFLLLIGVQTPGIGAEFVGGLLVLLSLVSLQVIGIEPAIFLLFIAGFALIVGELTTNIGFLGLAGAVCIVLGSVLIFPSPQWLMAPEVSNTIRNTLLASSAFLCIFLGFIVYKVAQARRQRARMGIEMIEGSKGVVTTRLDPYGEVRVGGEFWRALAEEGTIERGASVIVTRREGLVLKVRQAEQAASTRPGSPSRRR